jgi:hypothetical protein
MSHASPRVRLINPHTLTTKAWNRLASIAKLKAEEWGEGWLKLKEIFDGDKHLTEDTAIAALRGLSTATVAAGALALNAA